MYAPRKNAASDPPRANSRPVQPVRSRAARADHRPRPNQPSSARTPTNEAKLNAPKADRPHEPTDIGDHHLNIGRHVFDWISMCQNRSGRPRSMISRRPQTADQREGEVVRHADAAAVLLVAEQAGQGGHRVGPGRRSRPGRSTR